MILDQHKGSPDALEAPDWVQWKIGEVHESLMSREHAAYMAWSLIPYMPNLREVRTSYCHSLTRLFTSL